MSLLSFSDGSGVLPLVYNFLYPGVIAFSLLLWHIMNKFLP
jgi:hypothetical protein